MSWSSAIKKGAGQQASVPSSVSFLKPTIPQHVVDWSRLVSLDLETYYDTDYTLSKLSTSEYIRDPRFKAQMAGIKIGLGKTRIIPAARIRTELAKINWATHSLLCHHAQFDGFILSHHYGIHPAFIYCTLSMARGLHSNEIGAGLDEVSIFYGGQGKLEGLESTKGILNWSPALFKTTGVYCANDVDEMFRVFCLMLPKMPDDEIHLIDLTCRMFCSPVLKVNILRVEKELERELSKRQALMYAAVDPKRYDIGGDFYDKTLHAKLLKGPAERAMVGVERDLQIIRRVVGSSEMFAGLLRAEGVEPPVKISPAWIKKPKDLRGDEGKWAYAFAKDDNKFLELPNQVDTWGLDANDPEDVKRMVAKQERLQSLVDVRIATKSTTNITRAERFITAGADGMSLPCYYRYAAAHTFRWGGGDKRNMQNLTRGGELRLSIEAPKGYQLAVQDSGQIEARVNGWLWGQHDLLDAFRAADAGTGRDAYCNFGDHIYGREITKADKMERFVGKVCIAEGELVLTPRGLVPIQDISREDRIWDGVEWVTHDGVIDQGIKEVITYDGLTATPDHEVFTEDGRIIPLGQAASEMARLQNTGAERQSLRFCDDHVIADTPRKRLSVRVGSLQLERGQETDLPQQPQKWQDDIVPQKWAQTGAPCCGAGSPVRCDHCEMPQPGTQALEGLWRARDQMLVRVPDGVHSVDHTEPAPQRLHPGGDRPGEQRRELRARQLEAGDQVPAEPEQAQHPDDSLARPASLDSRVPQPVEPNVHLQVIESGADGRANPREVRTFDIVNAGPRRRYTVSGKLCLNCVLGLGFQMGAPKFQLTLAKGALGGPPVYFDLDRCKAIVNTYRLKNWAIVAGWDICKRIIEDMAAGREGSHGPLNWEKETIWLPNGMALKYPDLRKSRNDETGWDEWSYQAKEQRKKIYGGLLCLGAKTQVLTDAGWKSIVSVRLDDKLWDGTNWVSHSGLIHQGTKETIDFGGVDMTPDHEVLVNDQWIAAEETTHHEATSSFARHHRASARHDAPLASSGDVGHREHDAAVPQARRVAGGQDVRHARLQEQAVYDLADAGPLKRFTVRGDDGQPFVVHNCENIVQALARIIVAWQMLQISRKYRVVMTTHDEVVAMPKTAQADACLRFMAKWMSTAPEWCGTIPLNCEGGSASNYSK